MLMIEELKVLMIDYYPCSKSILVDCNIVRVYLWMTLFIFLPNHNLN
jgi:hypothetical protein